MQDNAPALPEDDKFMADIVRQIDLLPVPAALSERDIESEIRLVREIARAIKRRHLRTALVLMAAAVIVCVPVIALWVGFPAIGETLSRYSHYIFGGVAAITLSTALLKIRTFRV